MTRLSRARAALPIAGLVFVCAFRQQTHDEVVVEPSAAVTVRRTYVTAEVQMPRSYTPRPEDELRHEAMRASVCAIVMQWKGLWDRCETNGNTTVYEKFYPRGAARFAYLRGDTVGFALDRYVSDSAVGSTLAVMFKNAMNNGGLNDQQKAMLAAMREASASHLLTVYMPAPVRTMWGDAADGRSDTFTFDLWSEWPAGGRRNWTVEAIVAGVRPASRSSATAAQPVAPRPRIPAVAFWVLGLAAVAVLWPRGWRPRRDTST